MSQVLPDRRADNLMSGCKPRNPGNPGLQAIDFQAHKDPDRQTNRIALRDLQLVLTAFHACKLLQPAGIDFYLPGIQIMRGCLFNRHLQAASGLEYRVAVCANCPKYLDLAVPIQMDLSALDWDEDVTHCPVATSVDAHFPIGSQLGQPMPAQAAQQIQVGQPAIPTIKHHQLWRKAPLGYLVDQLLKVIVFAQAIFTLITDPEVTRQAAVAVGPDQRDQVDAQHDDIVLARPVPANQSHVGGVGLIQGAIIHHQHTLLEMHLSSHFSPQGLAIGGQALQQTRVGVTRGGLLAGRMGLGSFHTAKHALSRNQKMDEIQLITFGWIHAPSLAWRYTTP